jgi:TonB family protein
MRYAIAILIALSAAAGLPRTMASQEPSPAPAPAMAAPAGASEVKVAGRDVPAPRRKAFVQPVFPPEAQALGQRGIVIIELLIDTTGKVASADVLRSVPPFDQAALTAARQWEYEVTKVDGKPVPVRLTVPITFALKLPDVTREAGIPEMRQGALPPFPSGGKGTAVVVADVTLLSDGSVGEAAVREGDSPWSEALLQALRTWRFAADPGGTPIAFQVRAQFLPGPPQRVDLRLSGLRTAEDKPAAAAPAVAATPAPAAPTTVPSPTAQASPVPATRTAPTAAAPTPAATPAPRPAGTPPAPAPTPGTPVASAPVAPAHAANPPAAPPARPEGPRANPLSPANPPVTTPNPTAPSTNPTPPPVEVIPGGVPGAATASPAPRIETGVSAVRDIALGTGVPDLTKGRRPVAPPLARMSGVSGTVQVQFAVDAAGGTSVQNVSGPDLLKEAARQAVVSWNFRRTSAERVYLVALFSYNGDRAQAEVRRAE